MKSQTFLEVQGSDILEHKLLFLKTYFYNRIMLYFSGRITLVYKLKIWQFFKICLKFTCNVILIQSGIFEIFEKKIFGLHCVGIGDWNIRWLSSWWLLILGRCRSLSCQGYRWISCSWLNLALRNNTTFIFSVIRLINTFCASIFNATRQTIKFLHKSVLFHQNIYFTDFRCNLFKVFHY